MGFKAGFVGLIGQPNAGKSSLMNYLIDQKVSIVTPKPQTTRRRILGIQTTPEAQFIFVDAPGLIKSEKGLNAFLEKEAEEVMKESDVIVAVLSVDEQSAEDIQAVLDLVKKSKKPWLAIVTKTDLEEKAHRILIINNLVEELGAKCLKVSTIRDGIEGRADILKEIEQLLPKLPVPYHLKQQNKDG